ncbi:MAG: type VI secretion system contractile sheath large subunit [Bilophila sp.]
MTEAELSSQGAQTQTTELTLLDEIVEASKLRPQDEGYSATKVGLEEFLKQLVGSSPSVKISASLVDQMIADLDARLSSQVNAVLHNETFQKLESAWRGLKFLVDRTDFRQNIKMEFINVSKEDLLADFEDTPEVTKSGLYKHVYTAEYGQFGGQPVGVMIANYDFGPGPQDVQLLHFVSSVAAMAHAPFISAADKSFFGVEKWEELPNLKDLKSIFEMPQYTKWRGFRENEDARYVGLTLPRFLLRVPYGPETVPVKTFSFVEDVKETEDFCWGNTAFAFASRMSESFAKYRWCANIIGPQGGGSVDNLPVYTYESMGQMQTKIPTQVLISERREYELAEEGFIALTMRKGADNAAFFSANSCLRPKVFANTAEGKEAELNYKLSLQLPYMMIMNRLAHYIKVIQRENIGTWKERNDLDRELNKWISQYVTEMDDPDPTTRSRRPLRLARVTVSDVAGEPGWYSVGLLARPHFKYMGASFTLSLVGKLDKS